MWNLQCCKLQYTLLQCTYRVIKIVYTKNGGYSNALTFSTLLPLIFVYNIGNTLYNLLYPVSTRHNNAIDNNCNLFRRASL